MVESEFIFACIRFNWDFYNSMYFVAYDQLKQFLLPLESVSYATNQGFHVVQIIKELLWDTVSESLVIAWPTVEMTDPIWFIGSSLKMTETYQFHIKTILSTKDFLIKYQSLSKRQAK